MLATAANALLQAVTAGRDRQPPYEEDPMPFDGTQIEAVDRALRVGLLLRLDFLGVDLLDRGGETPALRRARLVEALRAPMPENVRFHYMTVSQQHACGSTVCALGLAAILWPNSASLLTTGFSVKSANEQGAFFGISGKDAAGVFWGQYGVYSRRSGSSITPEMVANALELCGSSGR